MADLQEYVYYLDGEELEKFLASGAPQHCGTGYEWEDEGVAHLRFTPLPHAFGRTLKVSFAREGAPHAEDADVKVDITGPQTAIANGVKAFVIPSRHNLYKRNEGLIEHDILAGKHVVVIGLGSGGSNIVVELAKAGTGSFALFDFDRVEPHNLVRHIAGINDLGRLKTDVVAQAVKGKNPYAIVKKFPIDITKDISLLEKEIEGADLVLCCTDNNQSRYETSLLLQKYGKTGIFGRAVTRAEGGDVFIARPGEPCYFCLLGRDWFDASSEEITDGNAARNNGRIPAYMSAEDVEAMVQVGLSSDIEPICNMMTKLALMELSAGADAAMGALRKEFASNYYIWANRRERYYANWGEFSNKEGMPTVMKWYGIDITHSPECPVCGHQHVLKTDDPLGLTAEMLGASDFSTLSLPPESE